MANDFKQLEKNDFEIVKQIDNSIDTFELARSFFLKNANGDIFVKKAGLHYKFDKRFGDRAYTVKKELPTKEELETLKSMYQIGEKEQFYAVKITLEFNDKQTSYTGWGIASTRDCNSNQILHGFYMAETRGLNRIMRELTQCGFTSVEEMSYDEKVESRPERNVKVINDNDVRKALESEFSNIIKSNIIKKEDALDLLKTAFGVDKTSKLNVDELQNYINILKDSVGVVEVTSEKQE